MTDLPLSAAFLAGASGRVTVSSKEGLEEGLGRLWEQAQRAWPSVSLEASPFLRYLGERAPKGQKVPEALERLRAAELYLACACAKGSESAIRAFEERFFPLLSGEASRLRVSGAEEELRQRLRRNFFVGREGQPPGVLQYSGEGPLGGWVRVSAMRELLKMRKAVDREVPVGDDALPEALGAGDDPELSHLQGHYRKEFATAFREAVGSLSARERTLLRQHFLDGLSIDDLGRLYQVHRATAARWLAKVREEVLHRTREALLTRLRVSRDELESIMRLIDSRLDVSMRVLFDQSGE